MDVRNSLTSLKQAIMAKIQLAASQQHTQAIIQLSTFAKQVDADLVTLFEIEERLRIYQDQLDTSNLSDRAEQGRNGQLGIKDLPRSLAEEVTNPSSKQQGMDAAVMARQVFIQACNERGIRLLSKKRTLVATPNGALIVLPFARELPDLPDRWFLGVQDGSTPSMCPYWCVAFLCQGMDKRLLTFIVPQKHLQQYWRQFGRHNGNVKFNIHREGVNFRLDVPGNNPIRLNAYQEAYANLKDV